MYDLFVCDKHNFDDCISIIYVSECNDYVLGLSDRESFYSP